MANTAQRRGEKGSDQLPELVRKMIRVAQLDKRIAVCLDSIERVEARKHGITTRLVGALRDGAKDDACKSAALGERLSALREERERVLLEIADDPATERLTHEEYSVLVGKYIDGHSLRRIAYLMFLSKSTINNRLYSALKKINDTE